MPEPADASAVQAALAGAARESLSLHVDCPRDVYVWRCTGERPCAPQAAEAARWAYRIGGGSPGKTNPSTVPCMYGSTPVECEM